MTTYLISSNQSEEIDFKVDGDKFALVQRFKSLGLGDSYKTIVMNRREALKLYSALWQELQGAG